MASNNTNVVKAGYWFPGNGVRLTPSEIVEKDYFTHIFCAFAKFDPRNKTVTDDSSEFSELLRIIKHRGKSVKVLLSIGGAGVTSPAFNAMASQPNSRRNFINSSINVALSKGYDGLDLDWEGQTTVDEMNNLGTLLDEFRAAIEARATPSLKLLLTAALRFTATAPGGAVMFPAQAIARNLDWVNVMSYDIYAPEWRDGPFTRPHASLQNPVNDNISVRGGIRAWINAGVPPNKLVLGLPFYGYTWTLDNPNDHGILAASSGPGGGTPSYRQIKDILMQHNAMVEYDPNYVTTYCYYENRWISYDDLRMIQIKVDYARTNGLLGYFAWSIEQDADWALSRQASQTWGA